MLHSFHPAGAPRVFLLPVIALVSIGGAAILFVTGNMIIGLVVLAVSVWLSYYLVRYTIYQFRSRVETTPQGLSCLTSMGVEIGMSWTEVTHAGLFTTERDRNYLFVYDENSDDLITIPTYYTDIDGLRTEIENHTERFLLLSGRTADDLAAEIRPLLDLPDTELHGGD